MASSPAAPAIFLIFVFSVFRDSFQSRMAFPDAS